MQTTKINWLHIVGLLSIQTPRTPMLMAPAVIHAVMIPAACLPIPLAIHLSGYVSVSLTIPLMTDKLPAFKELAICRNANQVLMILSTSSSPIQRYYTVR